MGIAVTPSERHASWCEIIKAERDELIAENARLREALERLRPMTAIEPKDCADAGAMSIAVGIIARALAESPEV